MFGSTVYLYSVFFMTMNILAFSISAFWYIYTSNMCIPIYIVYKNTIQLWCLHSDVEGSYSDPKLVASVIEMTNIIFFSSLPGLKRNIVLNPWVIKIEVRVKLAFCILNLFELPLKVHLTNWLISSCCSLHMTSISYELLKRHWNRQGDLDFTGRKTRNKDNWTTIK